MLQPKVYIKSLDLVLPVEIINFHEKTVEVYLNDNMDYVPFDFDEVEFIYSTGYKDKKGKEIESGDFLKTDFAGILSIRFHNVYGFYIVKEDDVYWFAEEAEEAEEEDKAKETLSKTEVIGNIYENKKLVE